MENPEPLSTDIDDMNRPDRQNRRVEPDSNMTRSPIESSIAIDIDDDTPDPQPDDTWIAVMGMTGVGKSTLISLLTEQDVGVGHNLQSSMVLLLSYDSADLKSQ